MVETWCYNTANVLSRRSLMNMPGSGSGHPGFACITACGVTPQAQIPALSWGYGDCIAGQGIVDHEYQELRDHPHGWGHRALLESDW